MARLLTSRTVLIILGVLVLLTGITTYLNIRSEGTLLTYDKGEVHIYPMAAARMIDGAEVFRPDDFKPFTYPPFMAFVFTPMTLLPQAAVRPVWYGCNAVMLLVIVVLLVDVFARFRPTDKTETGGPPLWVFWSMTTLLAARHVYSVFENQANDMVVFLFVMIGIHAMARGRDAVGGVSVGLGAASKATPLLFLPLLLWQRRWVASIAVGIGCVGALLLTDLIFPRADGQLWANAYYHTFVAKVEAVGGTADKVGNAWSAWNILNQNLGSTIYRLSTPVEPIANHTFDVSLWNPDRGTLRYLTLAAQLAVVGLIAWVMRVRPDRTAPAELAFRRLGEGGMIVCGMLLLSPMSSKSHFCVLLVPIAFCCHAFLYRRKSPLLAACLLIVFATTLTSKGILGRDLGNQILARGSVMWCTLAALIGTAAGLGLYPRVAPRTSDTNLSTPTANTANQTP